MTKNAIFKLIIPFMLVILSFGLFGFCAPVYAADAQYTVRYWFETNETGQYFAEHDKYYTLLFGYEKTLSGAADSYTNAYGLELQQAYDNYYLLPIKQEKIAADNSTVVDVFYNLKQIQLILDYGDGNTETLAAVTGSVAYFPTLPEKEGYNAVGWFMVDDGRYWGWSNSGWIGYDSLSDVRLNSSNALAGVQFFSYGESLTVIAKYVLIEYKIILRPNADDVSIYGWAHNAAENTYYQTYTINSTKPTLPTLTRDGFEFGGWEEVATSAGNTTVYEAVWNQPKKFSYEIVVYLENVGDSGFTQDIALSQRLEDLPNVMLEITPVQISGFTLDGEMSTTSAKLNRDGLKLNLYYKRNVYQLTFIASANDLNPVVKNYKFGASISAPPAATLHGYHFTGWQNLIATMPSHNLTIYANMVKNEGSLLVQKQTDFNEAVETNAVWMWITCGIIGAVAVGAGVYAFVRRK